tara:strand:- start:5 stop:121 length:117 start_codon:yes stop_codon:yes gene_type:complete
MVNYVNNFCEIKKITKEDIIMNPAPLFDLKVFRQLSVE